MGQSAQPRLCPSRAATPPTPNHKSIDTTRTQIILLAIGVLVLVIQLVLIIWFCGRRALVHRSPEQRIIAWEPVNTEVIPRDDEDDDRPARRRRNYRRSSTWNGRAVGTDDEGHPVRRRKSSGIRPVGPRSAVLLSGSDSDTGSSGRGIGTRNDIRRIATLAIPIVPDSPRRLRSPRSSPEPESDGSNVIPAREMHLMPLSAGSEAAFSPRSPRLGPIDQATVAILKEERRKSGMTPPMSPLVMDELDLIYGFDDPLGVNRRKSLFGDENEDLVAEESRRRSEEALLVNEDEVPKDLQLRRRKRRSSR